MNYNLIKVIDKELTPVERVLTNRGIDLSEVEHYYRKLWRKFIKTKGY